MTEIDRVTELCESAPGLEVGGGGRSDSIIDFANSETRSRAVASARSGSPS
jgi:hypothetical protein